MASPRDNRFNIGDKVHIAGMISEYRINEIEYDVKRAEFKYSLEAHPSWVFEHVLTKAGGDKVATSATDRRSTGKFRIGDEVEVSGIRDETFVIKEWRLEQDAKDGNIKTEYKLSNEHWYNEEHLTVAVWNTKSTEKDDEDWETSDEEPDKVEDTTDDEWDNIVEEATKEDRLPPPELRDVDVKTECKMMKPLPVKLEGPVGTGKTTILLELAKELDMKYYASVLTDQTSASEFKGYKNVMNGEYIRTEFREAVEFGGMYVLEELNAATSNMPIIFNTIENGYFVFADKLVDVHPDFWLCATMNSITNAKDFGGRRVVDKSVDDRFHTIMVYGDIASRYKTATIVYAEAVNTLLEEKGITDTVSPRDMRRFEHMLETTKVDKEVAIKKCLISNRLKIDEEWLRELTKNRGEWND